MTINYDFSGVANTDPYTLADFDHITALGGSNFQISSGSLRTTYSGSTTFNAIARYNGTASTTGIVSIDFTMLYDSASASGPIAVGLLDATGDGYMMLVNSGVVVIKEYSAGFAQAADLGGSATGTTFSAGDTLGVDFDLDNGTATAYINGTQHGTQATGLTLTGMAAGLILDPGDSNGNGIVTLDVTGEAESVAPDSLSVVSAGSTMQRGANYQVTIQDAPNVPTTSNTSLVSGNDSLACTLVEDLGNAQYRLTFAVGDLSKQVSATGYNWSVRVENS